MSETVFSYGGIAIFVHQIFDKMEESTHYFVPQPQDEHVLQAKGITASQVEEQLRAFRTGFPYLKISESAKVGSGIMQIDAVSLQNYHRIWDNFLKGDVSVVKFVPASGAASRMFKSLFEFLDGDSDVPGDPSVRKFFDEIKKFAFYPALDKAVKSNEGKNVDELLAAGQYKSVVANLLLARGLNYGSLPKGLLLFHSYSNEKRTPVKEHLVESALHATNKQGQVNVHFTVSKEHRSLFVKHVSTFVRGYEKRYGVRYNISFSEQKPSTDTIAATCDNEPFRDDDGQLVFRPGGHGALIENLNDLNADVIFIKNIDNVMPDSLKGDTIVYKKLLAGILIDLQQQTFAFLHELGNPKVGIARLRTMVDFCANGLNNFHPDVHSMSKSELRQYLVEKFNRPIRVCGMVKNTGEPGGGPYMIENADRSVAPQILESSQINLGNPHDREAMMSSTHFNPVDLVCATKNYRGERFDLLQYVDKQAGFISYKSKNGKELKALELPGLWNGAMSNWNTVFVEVPVSTFNPVKTVNDLLRPEHR